MRSAIHLASRGMQLTPLASHLPNGGTEREPLLTPREGDVLLLLRRAWATGRSRWSCRSASRPCARTRATSTASWASPRVARCCAPDAAEALAGDAQRGAAGHAAREPGDGARREPDAAVGDGGAERPERPLVPCMAIWPGPALELLEDAGPGAGGQRERPAVRGGGEGQPPPPRRTGRAGSGWRARRRWRGSGAPRGRVVDGDAARREPDPDPPRGGGRAGLAAADPARVPARAAREAGRAPRTARRA